MGTHVVALSILVTGFAMPAPGYAQAPPGDPIGVDQIDWVDPPTELPPGVTHHTFHSDSMAREVGYSIYLPPGYEGEDRKYAVVYWLHGRSGSERDTRAAEALHDAIQAGDLQPMVLVLANGGIASGYIDNPGTGVMGESVIIDDLIPHIEENYRVSADTSGRGLAGFSMGGAGAVRLVIRHPDLFGSVVAVAGTFVGYRGIMERNFVEDVDLAQRYDPFPNAINAAPRLRSIELMLLVGSADRWISENRRFAAHLGHQNLPIDYREIPGLEHELSDYLRASGQDVFRFFAGNLEPGG